MSCRSGPHWIPIVTALYLPLSFLVTYGIAVAYNHVSPGFPYISDTGTTPPESCIFGQALSIGAVLSGMCVYIRFQHVGLIQRHVMLNRVALVLGCAAAVGLSVVGNFQETSVHVVHIFGATLAFGVGVVYMWVNAVISFMVYPAIGSRELAAVRVILSLFSTIFAIIAIVGDITALSKYKGSGDERHWHPEDGGYTIHLVSTASEWLMACTFSTYFLTFATEFCHLKTHHMTVTERDCDLGREGATVIVA